MYNEIKYIPAGDKSVVMEFGNSIKPEINAKIRNMVTAVEENSIKGILEIIPTYRSILIIYDPLQIQYNSLVKYLKETLSRLGNASEGEIRIVELPTVYGGEYGPDIEFVANHNNLTVEEVIKLHSSIDYLLYMLGFTPGFGYLGGMSKKIETPRLQVPRTKIPAGSTGIAGSQTGIYPIDSPGGWQLIGRTPVKLYDPLGTPPILLNAGDFVRFIPISEEEYLKIQEEIKNGKYILNIIKGSDSHEHN
jgi:KipI family sensor histidine kinase inhibitor